jgi:excisionase family DNA binding protein
LPGSAITAISGEGIVAGVQRKRTNAVMPVVMDLKEASAYLVCSPRMLRDLVAAGRVKHARVGAKIVIRREWLDAFLRR